MKKFHIRSLPLDEVIRDMAEEFGTKHWENCEEFKLNIPEHIGEGHIRGINFLSGLGIILYQCTFKEDVELHFTVNDVHPAKFLYCTEGSLGHRFQNLNEGHSMNTHQSTIVASNGHNGHILYFKKGESIKISSLEIDREKFQARVACNVDTLDKTMQNLLKDVEANHTLYYKGDYSLKISDNLREIEEFEETGLLRKLFMEGKAYQMLTHQILQYQDDQKEEGARNVLRRSEVDKIQEARQLIHDELPSLGTIKELARKVGTNENKLQEGFQRLTQQTVNEYIKNARLNAAKELLITSDLSVSEIVYSIGLSNRGYFSKIFKNRFGISPNEFRRKHEHQT